MHFSLSDSCVLNYVWTWTADEWKLKDAHSCPCARACVLSWRQYGPSLTLRGHRPLTYLFFFSVRGRKVDHSLISQGKRNVLLSLIRMWRLKAGKNSPTVGQRSTLPPWMNTCLWLLISSCWRSTTNTLLQIQLSNYFLFIFTYLLWLCWQKH